MYTIEKILTKAAVLCFLMCSSLCASAQTTLTARVYAKPGSSKYYGKLYVPKGTKWRIAHAPAANTLIEVFSGHVDGSNIYLRATDLQDGGFWIDAEETDHILIVRSTSSADVVAEQVTSAQDEAFLVYNYYYDSSDKKRNKFKYTSAAVANSVLKSNSTYNTKSIYVMANPTKNGLAFLKLDPDVTSADLAPRSLYVLTKKSSAARLNVIFEDGSDDATGIVSVNAALPADNDAVYNLQGVRVTEPVKGMLYIRNGRKYVAE